MYFILFETSFFARGDIKNINFHFLSNLDQKVITSKYSRTIETQKYKLPEMAFFLLMFFFLPPRKVVLRAKLFKSQYIQDRVIVIFLLFYFLQNLFNLFGQIYGVIEVRFSVQVHLKKEKKSCFMNCVTILCLFVLRQYLKYSSKTYLEKKLLADCVIALFFN